MSVHRALSYLLAAAAVVVSLPGSSSAAPGRTVVVTTADDAGPGSFRAAVEKANADPGVSRILFAGRARTTALTSPVDFTGAQALTIDGDGATLDGGGITAGPAFRATGGGDLVW